MTTIEQAHQEHLDFKIHTYFTGRGSLRFEMFHVRHTPTGLETSRDSPDLGGALWCIKHFENIKSDKNFWQKGPLGGM